MVPTVSESRFLDHLVLEFSGELDLTSRPLFERARTRLDSADDSRVVLDLSRVTFLDCSSVHELEELLLHAEPEPSVVCPEGHPLRILRLIGFVDSHVVVPNLVQAATPRLADVIPMPTGRGFVRAVPG